MKTLAAKRITPPQIAASRRNLKTAAAISPEKFKEFPGLSPRNLSDSRGETFAAIRKTLKQMGKSRRNLKSRVSICLGHYFIRIWDLFRI